MHTRSLPAKAGNDGYAGTLVTIKKNTNEMYIVKGRIREFSIYGNNNVLRKGAPHFLPNTEVILCHFYNSQYRFHHKLWVRGKHRSGLLKTRGVYFKYLTDIRLEEVLAPSKKTLEFISKNGILTVNDNGTAYSLEEVKRMIDFFEEIQEPEILTGEINDELFFKAKEYLERLQDLLRRNEIEEVLEFCIKYPIQIKKRRAHKIQ